MKVKFGNGVKDVPIVEVTAANYIVPKGEEGTVHAKIEQKNFNAQTGERLSRPRIQKFEPKMWPSVKRNLLQQGWTIDILHDPSEWLREQAEKKAMSDAERARAAKEAAEKRKAEEKAALKAEIIAELKASGVIRENNTTEKKQGSSKK